ncbi:MAG: hypothetical protein AAGN66_00720 [Acidobacteriota bacterium]
MNFSRTTRGTAPSRLLPFLFALLCAALLLPAAASAADLRDILADFEGFDHDGDGDAELQILNPILDDGQPTPTNSNLVVVLLEKRLADANGNPFVFFALADRLQRLRQDLLAQGYVMQVVETQVYGHSSGEDAHQDGRTVLAMRELFRSISYSYGGFRGAVLIGNFPEASVVRSLLWRKHDDRITSHPQPLARRTDLVLGDLDGRWEDTYLQHPTELRSFNAVDLKESPGNPGPWPCEDCLLESRDFVTGTVAFEDVFYVKDDLYTLTGQDSSVLEIYMHQIRRGPELSPSDRLLQNPIARPELKISRIDAKRLAVIPDPAFRDENGKGWLDDQGRPQAVVPDSGPAWVHDLDLEYKLLFEYLDRNHAQRAGDTDGPFRSTALTFPEGDFPIASTRNFGEQASDDFAAPFTAPKDPSMVDYVRWLKENGTLKSVHTHADSTGTFVGGDYDRNQLHQEVGPQIWHWERSPGGDTFAPTLAKINDKADRRLFHSLWRNGALDHLDPAFYLHNGCDVNSPLSVESLPFNHIDYGWAQQAESYLFHLEGVAVLARSKDFNDRPEGFTDALASPGAPWGEGWFRQFDVSSQDAGLIDIQRKRSYSWGLLGDWTLTLPATFVDDAVVAFDHTQYRGWDLAIPRGLSTEADLGTYAKNTDSFAIHDHLELRMYHSPNGVGPYATVRHNLPDVDRYYYDNWIHSVEVRDRENTYATFYSGTGYTGTRAHVPTGFYTYTQLRDSFGILPTTISSMQLFGVDIVAFDRQSWWNNWTFLTSSTNNLGPKGWDNRIESVIIAPRNRYVTAYQNAGYHGDLLMLEPGRYDEGDLRDLGLDGWGISSIYVGNQVKVRAYRQSGFRGTPLVLDGSGTGNLQNLGWNDAIRSIIVEAR